MASPAQHYQRAEGAAEPLSADLAALLMASRAPSAPARAQRPAPAKPKGHKNTGLYIPDQDSRPLSKQQKARLGILSGEAYREQARLGLVDGRKTDDWRRDQVFACVRRSGLRECEQRHYKPLEGWFSVLAGRVGGADALAKITAPRDVQTRDWFAGRIDRAICALASCKGDADRPMGYQAAQRYALTIAQARSKPAVESIAQAVAVWPQNKLEQLLFTLEQRARSKGADFRD